jgi:hypothetical protein
MLKVYVDLKNRRTILPFETEMGAIYFVTSCREYAERHLEYLPAMDVVDDTTGEVVFQSPEVTPCEYHTWEDFTKALDRGDNPCQSCLKRDCGLRENNLPW